MPIIKSAIKKLRKDRKREKHNRAKKTLLKGALKKAQKSRREDDIRKAISLVGKAAKTHLIHEKKAARFTSRLAKLISERGRKTAVHKRKKPLSQKE